MLKIGITSTHKAMIFAGFALETLETSEEVIEKMKKYVRKGYTEGSVKVRDSGKYLS